MLHLIPHHLLQPTAHHYTCSHCNNDPAQLTTNPNGTHDIAIPHDKTCPVNRGRISALPDLIRAVQAARQHHPQ